MARRSRRHCEEENQALAFLLFAGGNAVYQIVRGIDQRSLLILVVSTVSILGASIYWLIRTRQRNARLQLLLASGADLTPTNFEQRVSVLLQDLGWQQVVRVGGAGDGGVDVRGSYEGARYIVQCKRYKGIVGPTHVRDLVGALHHEKGDRALLVTTGRVSDKTRDWAAGKPITIWDRQELAHQISLADAANANPAVIKRQKHRTRLMLGGLISVNLVALLVAFILPL